jgi:hypothetical protein
MNRFTKQQGSALIFILLGVSALSVPLSTSLKQAWFEEKMIQNSENNLQAETLANNGLKNALASLSASLNNGSTLETLLSENNGLLTKQTDSSGNGAEVYLLDDDNGETLADNQRSLLIRATGIYNDSLRNIEALLLVETTTTLNPNAALLANGDLELTGDSNITGSCGTIQANGHLNVQGSTYVTLSVNATDGISNPEKLDSPSINANGHSMAVPEITPESYKSLADYILSSDGKVTDKNGNLVADTSKGQSWNGWKMTKGIQGNTSWQLSGNDTLNGVTLYVEGDASVIGDPSLTYTDGWQVSIIAEHNISLQGNSTMIPNDTEGQYAGMSNLFMVAGGDLQISGNVTHLGNEALYLAHEQIELSGSSSLKGTIVAENAVHNIGLDISTTNKLTGNTALTNSNDCSNSDTDSTTTVNLQLRAQIETG